MSCNHQPSESAANQASVRGLVLVRLVAATRTLVRANRAAVDLDRFAAVAAHPPSGPRNQLLHERQHPESITWLVLDAGDAPPAPA
jgi:hypothetical protein